MGELAIRGEHVSGGLMCHDIDTLFRQDEQRRSIVVQVDSRPDLLNRSQFYELMTGCMGYGWSLYGSRAIRRVLKGIGRAPCFDHTDSVVDVGLDLLSRGDARPADDLLVILGDGGAGTVPTSVVQTAVSASYRRQAERLTQAEQRLRLLKPDEPVVVIDADEVARSAQ